MERHVEGEKRSKGNKSIVEIRRGMLHSQLIGEQMRGAQKLEGRHNTKDENNKANRRRKTRKGKGKIRNMGNKHKETEKSKRNNEEMGWGKQKLRGRVEKKGERKRTNNRKTTRKDIPKEGQRKNINRKQEKK